MSPPISPDIRQMCIKANPALLRCGKRKVYRPRFVRHRIESYAAIAADESWFCRMAAGVWNPCRSMSQVVL
jgi:hypothetical protein